LKDFERMLRCVIGEDIDLVMTLAKDLARIEIDPGQIEQVVMNLAVNARDAMPEGGKLTIETDNIEIDELYAQSHVSIVPGKYVAITVKDTGRGMDQETLSNVFEPFFTTKEQGKGTGLGLSTVYGIVKQSGGYIWAYSEPGQGTVFKICIPRTQAEPAVKADRPKEETPMGGGKHILIVEDEASLRSLIEKVLLSLGYRVSVAANADNALLLVEEKGLKPDLVITDVIMPGMSGVLLVERLRRNQSKLKVLLMSGWYADNSAVNHAGLNLNTPFIQKPFSIKEFAAKIQQVMREG
jgi:two-component system, cell cycle sensor histidine kinase and response regulator CckA